MPTTKKQEALNTLAALDAKLEQVRLKPDEEEKLDDLVQAVKRAKRAL